MDLRRELFILRAIAIIALIMSTLTGFAACRQSRGRNLGEVTVERINVVDGNGTLRMVIANKDRFPNELVTTSGKKSPRQGD